MISITQFRICDVHRLLDFDISNRLCEYCSICDSWICQEDSFRWDRRIRAMMKRKLEAGFQGDTTYSERLNDKGELK